MSQDSKCLKYKALNLSSQLYSLVLGGDNPKRLFLETNLPTHTLYFTYGIVVVAKTRLQFRIHTQI